MEAMLGLPWYVSIPVNSIVTGTIGIALLFFWSFFYGEIGDLLFGDEWDD